MKTFKKSIAVLLSVLLVISLVTTANITAFATDSVTVTVKSNQNAFGDVSETYKKNDIFEMAILWQSDDLLRALQYDCYLNVNGLKVIGQEIGPLFNDLYSNISEECQEEFGLVCANYTSVDGVDISTQSFIIKYKILVLDTASAEETINLDLLEMRGSKLPRDPVTSFINYIAGGKITDSVKDQFSADVTLGEGAPAVPVQPTSTSETTESTASETTESTASEPTESTASEPTESTASEPTESTASEPTESTTIPSDSSASDSTEPSTPTQPTATEPTESPEDETSSAKLPSVKLKASKINAGNRTKVTVYNANGKKISYSSSKKDVAKIDKNGIITGLKKGTTKLTIKVGTKVFKKNLTVKNNPTVKNGKKTLKNNATITLKKGQTKKLTITGKASAIKNKVSVKSKKIAKITSKSTDKKVTFKALKKGSTTLTIKINNVKTYKFKIRVK